MLRATAVPRPRPVSMIARHQRSSRRRVACAADVLSAKRERALEVARQLYEGAWSQGSTELLGSCMAPDHSQCDQIWQPENTGGGRERMQRGIEAFRRAYPDLRFTITDAAATDAGDAVFVHWEAAGTNTGPLGQRPPTGQRIQFSGASLLRLNEAGQIRQSLVYRQATEGEARSLFVAQMRGEAAEEQQQAAGGP